VQGREVLQEFLESTAATEKFIRSVDEKLTESTQKYEGKYRTGCACCTGSHILLYIAVSMLTAATMARETK